jgi:mono/diheme cytochrome c family protein
LKSRKSFAHWGAIVLTMFSPMAFADTTPLSGIYSEDQAKRGADLYALNCARCHGATLDGSYDVPSLRGGFVARWAGSSLERLVDYVYRAMPLHQPGALSRETDADIIAYILAQNRFPAGATDISADVKVLSHIQFQAAGRITQ